MTFERSPDGDLSGHPGPDTSTSPGGVPATEWQTFARHVRAAGFDPAEFLVTEHPSVAPTGAEPARVVSVLRKGDGRDFDAGPGHDWVSDAAQALRAGHFGTR